MKQIHVNYDEQHVLNLQKKNPADQERRLMLHIGATFAANDSSGSHR